MEFKHFVLFQKKTQHLVVMWFLNVTTIIIPDIY